MSVAAFAVEAAGASAVVATPLAYRLLTRGRRRYKRALEHIAAMEKQLNIRPDTFLDVVDGAWETPAEIKSQAAQGGGPTLIASPFAFIATATEILDSKPKPRRESPYVPLLDEEYFAKKREREAFRMPFYSASMYYPGTAYYRDFQ